MVRSRSSLPGAGLRAKLGEGLSLLRLHGDRATRRERIENILDQVESYRAIYEQHTGRPFTSARAFEIGYGAQPFRLIALASMGLDARGIDLDLPLLGFSPARIAAIGRRNGAERAFKSAVRSLLFDRRDRREFKSALARRGYALKIDPAAFLTGDAVRADFGPVDFIYSEDVFEHIPATELEQLVARMAAALRPGGLALITPNVWTGITGGHLPEWYWDDEHDTSSRRSEPWEHLRRARFQANTSLNRLARADYRTLFERHFRIVSETALYGDLGRRRLTPEVRQELAAWSEEELFSNAVQFVLLPN